MGATALLALGGAFVLLQFQVEIVD